MTKSEGEQKPVEAKYSATFSQFQWVRKEASVVKARGAEQVQLDIAGQTRTQNPDQPAVQFPRVLSPEKIMLMQQHELDRRRFTEIKQDS
ncbi:MAG: hypothetical protein M1524_01050 [Patescibacteria group bacterium]|nr:hypothetical protein [Patescibacteria group bacterium]